MLPIIYTDEFLLHDPGNFHPESPARLSAITTVLRTLPWKEHLDWRSPSSPEVRGDMLLHIIYHIHTEGYVEAVKQVAHQGGGNLDPDTVVSPHTYEVALLAVNAWLDGVDEALIADRPVFVLARPPGHHALRDRGMGFCIFNHEAIASHYALTQPGCQRVAILDWDVHHGNGTQTLVQHHPSIAYCSLHQSPLFPGTGRSNDRGPFGNVLNIPMLPQSSIADYKPAFERQVVPFLSNFQPDLLIVSAGYDACTTDPLADICLEPEDFGLFTRYCLPITRRIVFGLEGGYDPPALAQSVVATIEPCLGVIND
ncbi:hypothetical protein BST81_24925 [Leptolyngbya sp. 'hensonii']|uniref:histone deacetylase family protein n=1 Tax=Leptolyngbya sp. 'hensonii' TaxID=1922337 RepID=UPI00095032DB|nr:histone deacetylase [Leptolyngbya sp. 'hensonii']OLP15679.1 hypothetical protein BST81_24925 [Leptolyngbya sp. 'hensonii']